MLAVLVVQQIVDAGYGDLQFREALVQVLHNLLGDRGQVANHIAKVANPNGLDGLEFAAGWGELRVLCSGSNFQEVIGEGSQS